MDLFCNADRTQTKLHELYKHITEFMMPLVAKVSITTNTENAVCVLCVLHDC